MPKSKVRLAADFMSKVEADPDTGEAKLSSSALGGGNAPAELDTFEELAAAIGNNPNFAADAEASNILTTAAIVDIQDRYIADNP